METLRKWEDLMGNLLIIKVSLSDDHFMDIGGQANLGNLRICDMGRSPRIWGFALAEKPQ
jgi:hypothetical protein